MDGHVLGKIVNKKILIQSGKRFLITFFITLNDSIKTYMLKIGIWIKNILFFLIMFLTIVLSVEWILSKIHCYKEQDGKDISIFLLSNGVHVDIVVPVKTAWIDWSQEFPYQHTLSKDTNRQYLGIGWGDKGFYLNTPTWADLKFSTAINAVIGQGGSALHCTYMHEPIESEQRVALQISVEQYKQLIAFVKEGMVVNATGKAIWIPTDAAYGQHDAFYEANGSYNMFQTCNTWTNRALKHAQIKSAVWLLFEKSIMNIYK